MSEIVTARVPSEIRRQGNETLERIGSSPTELVRAAYAYVIENEALPGRSARDHEPRRPKTLSDEARGELMRSLSCGTLPISPDAWPQQSYKDLLAEGRRADYEALA